MIEEKRSADNSDARMNWHPHHGLIDYSIKTCQFEHIAVSVARHAMSFGHILAILLYFSQNDSGEEILDPINVRIVTGSCRLTRPVAQKMQT